MINFLNIVVIFQSVDKFQKLLRGFQIADIGFNRRFPVQTRGRRRAESFFQRFGNRIQILGNRFNLMCIFVGNHIIGSGFQRRFKHFVGIGRIGRIFDIADSFKIESHRAALAHNAAAFSENGTDIAGRPVLIVGHCFDDNRYLAGAKPLVTGRNIIVAAGRLAGFGNGAFNIVLRHALGTAA